MLFQNNKRLTVASFCMKQQKAKKAKTNIAEIRIRQQTKMLGKNVSRQNILAAHSSEESDFMDDSL
jgi:hypothetical protein